VDQAPYHRKPEIRSLCNGTRKGRRDDTADGPLARQVREDEHVTSKHHTHFEAPVESVFNFFKDPKNWQELPHADQVTIQVAA